MARKTMVVVGTGGLCLHSPASGSAGVRRRGDGAARDGDVRDYYQTRYPALFYHLYESSRRGFGFSPLDSARVYRDAQGEGITATDWSDIERQLRGAYERLHA